MEQQRPTPHNLGLYRLEGFSGRGRELIMLRDWLVRSDALPAMAVSGEQGNGKSTFATAAAWNLYHHFSDGILRVSAAGTNPFRLYDIVRTLDTVFGTRLTRVSEERWGISILEQLYRRRRLLIIDKLAGGTEREVATLVDIIGHLHEAGGHSRIVLIDRNFSQLIAGLVQHQHLHLGGLDFEDVPTFVQRRGPAAAVQRLDGKLEEFYALTEGKPLMMRIVLGLLMDYSWSELSGFVGDLVQADGSLDPFAVVAFAVENLAVFQPQVGPLLNRLVSASGGASTTALHELFWSDLGAESELTDVLSSLKDRALVEEDRYRQRIVLHPIVRRYLEQNVVMLGEDWDRSHASYYLNFAQRYQYLPQERWPEIDVEWGNIFQAADWCLARVQRLWQREPLDVIADSALDLSAPSLPPAIQSARDDLRLARTYALSLAFYAFWRHPLGILRWLAAGALAALALRDRGDYARLLTSIGRQYFFTGEIEAAIQWLERAQRIFDEQDLLSELGYVFTDQGTSLRILDKPRQAMNYFHAAFDSVVQTGDLAALTTAYMNLGSAYYSIGNYERALREHQKALRIALRRQDHHSVASAYNNMGLAMEGLDKTDEAMRAYELALDVFRRTGDVTGISTCYNNLGSACYAQGDYAQALTWYELDLALSEERGNWTDMAATLHNLGHVALEQEDYGRALGYFEQSRDLYAAFELTEYVAEENEMIDYIHSLEPRVHSS